MTDNQPEIEIKPVKAIVHFAVTIGILFLAFTVVGGMFATKPEARKFGNRPPPSVAVETTKVEAIDYQVWIDSFGSATPLTQTKLVSDVSGRVVEVSPNIRAGRPFEAGEVLVRIDPRDYRIEVDVARAAVADADVKYKQELAQADIAKRDWNVRPGNAKGKSLALREPQVAAALANLESAKARLARAELNLERTEVRAPFDGKILKQMVDLGQVVNPSQAIAEIYSTELIEVRLPVKPQDLTYIQLPDEMTIDRFPKVMLESDIGNQTYTWEGQLVRSEGAFDASTRMLYVVAQVQNPFEPTATAPAMRIGQFLRAKIEGSELKNVYAIPRRAVTQDNMIAVAEEGILTKRKVQPLWTDRQAVVISASSGLDSSFNNAGVMAGASVLDANDTLILTPTANLASGTRVKPINEPGQPRGSFAKGGGKMEKQKANGGEGSKSGGAVGTAASSANAAPSDSE